MNIRAFILILLGGACAPPELGPLPDQGASATGLVLVIHGSGDSPEDWAETLGDRIHGALDEPELWDVATYDWTEDAAGKLSAARRGEAHGRAIGQILTEERDYASVQIIAHSVGGHVSHGIAHTWTEGILQQTFLDPFGGRGLVRWSYGHRRFGQDASYAETYFNSDDGVPSTERAPVHTHGFDVTAARSAEHDEDAHWWPICWYQDSLGSGMGLDLALPFGGEERWADFPIDAQTVLSP